MEDSSAAVAVEGTAAAFAVDRDLTCAKNCRGYRTYSQYSNSQNVDGNVEVLEVIMTYQQESNAGKELS